MNVARMELPAEEIVSVRREWIFQWQRERHQLEARCEGQHRLILMLYSFSIVTLLGALVGGL